MSIAGILGFVFFYIAIGLIFYALCITASEADRQMEQEFRENYWRTTYNNQGGDHND